MKKGDGKRLSTTLIESTGFEIAQSDAATVEVGSPERLTAHDKYTKGLEHDFFRLFARMIKTLGLEHVKDHATLREILQTCVEEYSGFDRIKGVSKRRPVRLGEGGIPIPFTFDQDPLLSQIQADDEHMCQFMPKIEKPGIVVLQELGKKEFDKQMERYLLAKDKLTAELRRKCEMILADLNIAYLTLKNLGGK